MQQCKILSRANIASLIADGDIIVINEGMVLRLNAWLEYHPGGRLVIQHMVGRDATDEISITNECSKKTPGTFLDRTHLPSTEDKPQAEQAVDDAPSCDLEDILPEDKADVLSTLRREPDNAEIVKQALENDIDQYPSLDAQTQQGIVKKYRELHQRIKREGYYTCQYREYMTELARYLCIFAAFLVTLRAGWFTTSAALLGLFWHQIMFTAHDAGHQGITHNFVIDTLIGMFVADFCCGLSIGWWKSSHNEHDPDIQNAPLFATSPSFLASFHSSYYNFTFLWDQAAQMAIPYQRYTYYPVMGIARFNLYLLSWCHLLSRRSSTFGSAAWTRPTETCFMLMYWFLFGYCLVWRSIPTWPLRIVFVLVSHIITMPLHVQITLSHWSMSTSDLGEAESFPQHQLRTTMDVECPSWLDPLHGGLQFQAVHHLFPGVPRHNLRRLQQLVIGFCDETGIKYKKLGFVAGNRDVLGKLGEVAAQLDLMIKCQKHMADTGESGLL
ncbi:MAG: hypothetical protein Q9220_003348 [cf. Caloplaca sp. 1 TL-2023]